MTNLPKVILPGQTIGIIGGGQLGRMMALSAKAMGFRIAVLDPTKGCPCGQVADIEINGAYDDLDAIRQLSEVSDVITYEFENVSFEALAWLNENSYLPQGAELLKITQNRITEKAAINDVGVPVAPYGVAENTLDIHENVKTLGYPCVMKKIRGGYDGKGQLVIHSESDIEQASELLASGTCVIEKWIPFTKEISVIITRKPTGEMKCFPVAENIHHENILHTSIVPARISEEISHKAVQLAEQLADRLNLVGTLAVEMFVTEGDEILVNELAPRPHNSGHYTMEACQTSQFEQHIRAVCNWSLGNTDLMSPVVMVNILGEHVQDLLEVIPEAVTWKIHLYGKKDALVKRKMGHVNVLRTTIDQSLAEIEQSGIWNHQLKYDVSH
ncbi:5-(carboxyamino)imidazole ribonucleotide synthase [Sporosarcina aquimarina]|uniref:N5-carboxyaminoimidazole ribonucleotide synthase n=1 Tax=Sporosarcina aquimarina TaxID=114975 RepID=A0ABU4FXT7_9BACL|nr:5-(carboxyamino)imidazole ribonucleotide synthase [Sporosarcina aquimarina]MDW0109539.1 5-(carboxyamino)imidazole ribonucleotide synthase [Sporosarcina aquimarina]